MDRLCSLCCSDHTGARVYGAVPGEGPGVWGQELRMGELLPAL